MDLLESLCDLPKSSATACSISLLKFSPRLIRDLEYVADKLKAQPYVTRYRRDVLRGACGLLLRSGLGAAEDYDKFMPWLKMLPQPVQKIRISAADRQFSITNVILPTIKLLQDAGRELDSISASDGSSLENSLLSRLEKLHIGDPNSLDSLLKMLDDEMQLDMSHCDALMQAGAYSISTELRSAEGSIHVTFYGGDAPDNEHIKEKLISCHEDFKKNPEILNIHVLPGYVGKSDSR
eukprot:m.192999 g.192999  ORF g.192999 m.192999 type:complete len:237 (+) comp18614_c0_seq1:58-768(+)